MNSASRSPFASSFYTGITNRAHPAYGVQQPLAPERQFGDQFGVQGGYNQDEVYRYLEKLFPGQQNVKGIGDSLIQKANQRYGMGMYDQQMDQAFGAQPPPNAMQKKPMRQF